MQIKTQQKYVWSKRDSTEQGRPLGEVVEQVRSCLAPSQLLSEHCIVAFVKWDCFRGLSYLPHPFGRAGSTPATCIKENNLSCVPLFLFLLEGLNSSEERQRRGWGGAEGDQAAVLSGFLQGPGGSGWSQCALGKDNVKERRQKPCKKGV